MLVVMTEKNVDAVVVLDDDRRGILTGREITMATVENDDIKVEDVIKQDTTENSDMENRCCYFSDVMIGELLAG